MSLLRRWIGRARTEHAPPSGRWVVVDTETSGLDPLRDALLAIGGVAVDDEGIAVEDSFEVVLRNEPVAEAANVVVHGIGHDAQRNGVPAAEALAAFSAWAGTAPRVGFHTDFDAAVLGRAFAAHGLGAAPDEWLDLARLGPALAPEVDKRGGKSLDDWLAAFAIETTERHNAAGDAFATAELLLRLRARGAAQGARGFPALLRVARSQKWLSAR